MKWKIQPSSDFYKKKNVLLDRIQNFYVIELCLDCKEMMVSLECTFI